MDKSLDLVIGEMFKDRKHFKDAFEVFMELTYAKTIEESSNFEKYAVLSRMVMSYSMDNWRATKRLIRKNHVKSLYYFSLEFLMGRMLSNNLHALGIYSVTKEALKELNVDFNEIENIEMDAGLGNGGLGRLAACFMDSLASNAYAGNGNCIRYRNGLFKQLIIDNKQVEVPDRWLRNGYPWEVCKPEKAVEIKFYGKVNISRDQNGDLTFDHVDAEKVLAMPYDVPIIGGDGKTCNTLRLWSAEPADEYPKNRDYVEYLMDVDRICLNLYPEDYSEEGKLVRIKQEYFFVAAGLKKIVDEHLKKYPSLDNLGDEVAIQLNDTHPALAIPELMRILMDEYHYSWKDSWPICKSVFSYTNHTILQEALEKWPVEYIKRLLPRIWLIIEEIDRQFIIFLKEKGKSNDFINNLRIVSDDSVRMAYLSIVGSNHVNGVAKLHTDILIEDLFRGFYEIYPEKFSNKTNGITHRRWLLYANKELGDFVSKTIGYDLHNDFFKIEELMKYVDDPIVQNNFLEIKYQKKCELAAFLKKNYAIEIDPNSIFDVQAKRLHAYKRQLLNILHVISLYQRILKDPSFTMPKTTFIFGAKAASNYFFAKKVIELINCVGQVIDNNEKARQFIKVVFIPNYSVTIAEKLMPAADVSEQISTAGKEASGTGNMKFMMNGAITLGTLDGANVEIHELVGDENMVLFGKTKDEIYELSKNYNPYTYYQNDPEIKDAIDSLVDGTFMEDKTCFEELANEFLHRNDEYYILADFKSYKEAHERINALYLDKAKWAKMALINIAKSSYFSSDRTINDYVKDIWHLNKIS